MPCNLTNESSEQNVVEAVLPSRNELDKGPNIIENVAVCTSNKVTLSIFCVDCSSLKVIGLSFY